MRADAVGASRISRVGARSAHATEEQQNQLLTEIRDDIGVVCPEYSELAQNLRHFAARHLAAEEPRGMLLGVVSANVGEGRTTVAFGLAGALADMCANVALVELGGEPDQPSITAELGLHPTLGLNSYLRSDATLDDVVQRTGKPNLWLLPAGPGANGPNRALTSSGGSALLSGLRERYAVTVFDVPALLASEESPALVGQLDAAVLVVAAGRTKSEEVAESVALLGDVPLRGVLLNQVRLHTPRWLASLIHER